MVPMLSRPRTSLPQAATSPRARSTAARASRAGPRNASPASVTRTRRLVRSNSRVPNSLSSRAIWWLSADWTTKQR